MPLNTKSLDNCIKKLEFAFKSYYFLKSESEKEIYRSAIVKEFELIVEIIPALLKKILYDYESKSKLNTSYKEILRYATKHQIITLELAEKWFVYREIRNKLAHDYGEEIADEIFEVISNFINDSKMLSNQINSKINTEDNIFN